MRKATKFVMKLFIFMIFSEVLLYSQTFSVSEIDVSNFPRVRATFFALDGLGKPYSNLSINDFDVVENGQSMDATLELECIDSLEVPSVSIIVVLDQSNSMLEQYETGERRWDWVVEGATSFINTIDFVNAPETRVAIVSFGQISLLRAGFSNNKQLLVDSVKKTIVGGATNYNSVFFGPNISAVELLKTRPPQLRRIMVFLTDGQPTTTPQTAQIISALSDANIQFYAITLAMPMNDDLAQIASATGGRYYAVYTKEELNNIYQFIALDIQNKQLCNLYWQAPYSCSPTDINRNIEITFLRNNKQYKRSYTVPSSSIAKIESSSGTIPFGNPPANNYTEVDVPLKAINSDFTVNSITILPSTFFQVVDWDVGGSGGPPPFTIAKNQTRTIKVRFTQGSTVGFRKATMLINASPCNGEIQLIGGISQILIIYPNGGEVFSICDTINIQWTGVDPGTPITLQYSTDGGNRWNTIASNLYGTNYRWLPPTSGDRYLVRGVVFQKTSYLWAYNFGGKGQDGGTSLAVQSDNLYFYHCGFFEDTLMYGPQKIESRGSKDIFLAKCDSDGNIIWVTTAGSSRADSASGVIIDPQNNIYMTGSCNFGVQFGNIKPYQEVDNASYCFVAKYTSNLSTPVVALLGPTSLYPNFRAWGQRIMYENNLIYVQGEYTGRINFSSFGLPNVSTPTKFVATYTSDLQLINLVREASDNPKYSKAFGYDSYGNLYETGRFSGTLTSGSISLRSNGDIDVFIRKFGSQPGSSDESDSLFRVETPVLNLKSSSADAGIVTLGSSKDTTFFQLLCNTGKIPITIKGYNFIGSNPGDFRLVSNLVSFTIMPGECINLEVNFQPSAMGVRRAVLVLYADCLSPLFLNLSGTGVCSGLAVEEVDFGNVNINIQKPLVITCAFKNTNTTNILIEPFIEGPDRTSFDFTPKGSFIVPKDSCRDFTVTFTPTTPGPKVAYLNYGLPPECDVVRTKLIGNGINFDFNVSEADFDERRLLTVNDTVITIFNNSVVPQIVDSIEFESSTQTIFSFVDKPALPLSIPANNSLDIKVRFVPTEEIEYRESIRIKIRNMAGYLMTNIRGVGILPKLEAQYDCGEPVTPNTLTEILFTVRNPSSSADLYIERIDFETPSTEFSWKNGVPQNIIIPKQSDTTFTINYKPTGTGVRSVNVVIISDAAPGPNPNPRVRSDYPVLCDAIGISAVDEVDFGSMLICESNVQNIRIFNESWRTNIEVTGYEFVGGDPSAFEFIGQSNFTIEKGNYYDITVKFTPTADKYYETTLKLYTTAGYTLSIKLKGYGNYIYLFTPNREIKVVPGTEKKIPVYAKILKTNSGQLNYLEMMVKYNPNMLYFKEGSLVNRLNNWVWENPTKVSAGVLNVKGSGNLPLAFEGPLFELEFFIYLGDLKESNIYFQPIIQNCETYDTLATVIKLTDVCFLSGRLIKSSNIPYGLYPPVPNPAQDRTEIEFSIAFEYPTRIEIFNSMGELILTLVDKELPSGFYSLVLDTQAIPSGVYYIRMQSGTFTQTQLLNIAK